MLTAKGLKWRDYAEDISGSDCPITSSGQLRHQARAVPLLPGRRRQPAERDQRHVQGATSVPTPSSRADLKGGTVAQYNFITPNLCDDMHGALGLPEHTIATGDTWLSHQIPMIMASNAYKNNGAIFITWDESEGGEFPIGMIVLSPKAKGNGYQSTTQVLPLVDGAHGPGGLRPLAAARRRGEPAEPVRSLHDVPVSLDPPPRADG